MSTRTFRCRRSPRNHMWRYFIKPAPEAVALSPVRCLCIFQVPQTPTSPPIFVDTPHSRSQRTASSVSEESTPAFTTVHSSKTFNLSGWRHSFACVLSASSHIFTCLNHKLCDPQDYGEDFEDDISEVSYCCDHLLWMKLCGAQSSCILHIRPSGSFCRKS